MQGVGVIRKLSKILPQTSIVTIQKSFVKLHLDYGNVLYDQPNNESLCQKSLCQYNTCLAIMGAIRGTSQMKYIINWDWNLSSLGVSLENFVYFSARRRQLNFLLYVPH